MYKISLAFLLLFVVPCFAVAQDNIGKINDELQEIIVKPVEIPPDKWDRWNGYNTTYSHCYLLIGDKL
jgi:hypothetical protein